MVMPEMYSDVLGVKECFVCGEGFFFVKFLPWFGEVYWSGRITSVDYKGEAAFNMLIDKELVYVCSEVCASLNRVCDNDVVLTKSAFLEDAGAKA